MNWQTGLGIGLMGVGWGLGIFFACWGFSKLQPFTQKRLLDKLEQ